MAKLKTTNQRWTVILFVLQGHVWVLKGEDGYPHMFLDLLEARRFATVNPTMAMEASSTIVCLDMSTGETDIL